MSTNNEMSILSNSGNENSDTVIQLSAKKNNLKIKNENQKTIDEYTNLNAKYEGYIGTLESNYKKIIKKIKDFKLTVESVIIQEVTISSNNENTMKNNIKALYNSFYSNNIEYNTIRDAIKKNYDNSDKLHKKIKSNLESLEKLKIEFRRKLNTNEENYAEEILPKIKKLINDNKTLDENIKKIIEFTNIDIDEFWGKSIIEYKTKLTEYINEYYTELIKSSQSTITFTNFNTKTKKEKIELLAGFKENINKINKYISSLKELFDNTNIRKDYFKNETNYNVNVTKLTNLKNNLSILEEQIKTLESELDEKINNFKNTTEKEIEKLFEDMNAHYQELIDITTEFFRTLENKSKVLNNNKKLSNEFSSEIQLSQQQKNLLPKLESLYTNFKSLSGTYNNKVPADLIELLKKQIGNISGKLNIMMKSSRERSTIPESLTKNNKSITPEVNKRITPPPVNKIKNFKNKVEKIIQKGKKTGELIKELKKTNLGKGKWQDEIKKLVNEIKTPNQYGNYNNSRYIQKELVNNANSKKFNAINPL